MVIWSDKDMTDMEVVEDATKENRTLLINVLKMCRKSC